VLDIFVGDLRLPRLEKGRLDVEELEYRALGAPELLVVELSGTALIHHPLP
jgi:hypothetical protein